METAAVTVVCASGDGGVGAGRECVGVGIGRIGRLANEWALVVVNRDLRVCMYK